jgi:phosphohistidine phosphatase SixA
MRLRAGTILRLGREKTIRPNHGHHSSYLSWWCLPVLPAVVPPRRRSRCGPGQGSAARGLRLLLRHMSSPMALPGANVLDKANLNRERQLDDRRSSDAAAFGSFLRREKIRVGRVWTRRAHRARETAALAGLPSPTIVDALDDPNRSMTSTSALADATWLLQAASGRPTRHADTIIITHVPNLVAAHSDVAKDLGSGDAAHTEPGRRIRGACGHD